MDDSAKTTAEEAVQQAKVSVLFVCLGNICRSPSAEAVFRQLVEEGGLSDRVQIDSAGTGDWHVGAAPDERATAAAKSRGYELSALRARQVAQDDCMQHDYLIVMDGQNFDAVKELCPNANARRLLDFAPDQKVRDVPDPYYGGEDGFDEVLDLIVEATRGLLADVKGRLKVPAVELGG
ncbi:MAG: low molecular weight protein-tyrosine-phosphatase [Trueperaceae bacterium]